MTRFHRSVFFRSARRVSQALLWGLVRIAALPELAQPRRNLLVRGLAIPAFYLAIILATLGLLGRENVWAQQPQLASSIPTHNSTVGVSKNKHGDTANCGARCASDSSRMTMGAGEAINQGGIRRLPLDQFAEITPSVVFLCYIESGRLPPFPPRKRAFPTQPSEPPPFSHTSL